jgi:gluconokinase
VTVSPADAERPLVVALDIGSSSVKAAVHDRQGRALEGHASHVPYRWSTGPDGAVRLPADVLFDQVAQALDGIEGELGPLADDVVAAGVSCLLHSFLGLDDAGRPVSDVLSWADTSSAAAAIELREGVDPEAVHETTGAPIHAGYWPARIRHLRQEVPAARCWSGFPEVLAGRLTGHAVVGRSQASGTGLLDRSKGGWSAAVLAALGVDPSDLPAIVDDDAALGPLVGEAARRWPRLARITWYVPLGDGPCSNVGLDVARPGTAALLVGTSGALRSIVRDPAVPLPPGLFAQRFGPGAVVGGQLSEGGGTIRWISDLLGSSESTLERAAAEIPADGHGLTVLPYTFGERGLGYHDAASGAIVGLRGDTDAAAVYRATIESMALSFAAVDERLTTVLGAAPSIVAAGGALAHSRLLTQTLADALGRAISVASDVESSRRGAALLALQAAGQLDDVTAVPGPPGRTVPNDPERTDRYRAARARRDALYGALLS